jgi:hypothetical protein
VEIDELEDGATAVSAGCVSFRDYERQGELEVCSTFFGSQRLEITGEIL